MKTVETPLIVSGAAETQKWVLFKDAATVKLSVIKGFTAMIKHGGNNVLKNLDKWVKDHCSMTQGHQDSIGERLPQLVQRGQVRQEC